MIEVSLGGLLLIILMFVSYVSLAQILNDPVLSLFTPWVSNDVTVYVFNLFQFRPCCSRLVWIVWMVPLKLMHFFQEWTLIVWICLVDPYIHLPLLLVDTLTTTMGVFLKFLEVINPFHKTTYTSILDFWQRLSCVSKPWLIPCILSCLCDPQIHL